jgi:cyclophilin family peptidyl-prolyl cis-trans isomerase/HEAT repeat protein
VPRRTLLLHLLLVLAAGCGRLPETAFHEELDTLTDRRVTDSARWDSLAGQAGDPGERLALARAVGQVRDTRLAPLVHDWLQAETEPDVLAEQIFAVGQIGEPGSVPLLLPLLSSPSAAVRSRAAEALGKLGDSSVVIALLGLLEDPEAEARSAALLAVVRLRGRRVAPEEPLPAEIEMAFRDAAAALLRDPDQGVRWRASYALAETEIPGRLPLLTEAARATEDLVRLFAVRGLGRLADGTRARTAILGPMVANDPNPHVAASVADALAALGRSQDIEPLLEAARRTASPSDHHRRQAAVRALGVLAPASPEQGSRVRAGLLESLDDPSPAVRLAGLRSLAARFPETALSLVETHAGSESAIDRLAASRAGEALTSPRAGELLAQLVQDPVPMVASAALMALAAREEETGAARRAALGVLGVEDVAVRGTALAVLGEHGEPADLAAITSAYRHSTGTDWVEGRIEALGAAAAVAGEAAADLLGEALRDESPAVRRLASRLMAETLEIPRPEELTQGPPSSVPLPVMSESRGSRTRPRARLRTERGDIVIELLADAAPRHVGSFMALARSGFYDGLPFHRVVSGFVVQGLDPRGDGWGTGGIFLRDEIHPVPYLTGTVGMPNAGPDTGGCQIFITHVPTPHLDGGYTVFGRVVKGMEAVDALDLGDRCLQVEILD